MSTETNSNWLFDKKLNAPTQESPNQNQFFEEACSITIFQLCNTRSNYQHIPNPHTPQTIKKKKGIKISS